MVEVFEILATAAISSLATLIIREIWAWKFSELERLRGRNERLLEKVYGPLRVVTWRMELDERRTHKYWITEDEYLEIQRLVFLFNYHIVVPEFLELLNFLLQQVMKHDDAMIRFRQDGKIQLAFDPPKIKELINLSEEHYEFITNEIQMLHHMRKGFLNNFKFVFLKWKF